MLSLKSIVVGLILFILLYLEPVNIGPVKFSHVWKIVAMYLCVLSIILALIQNRSRYVMSDLYRSNTLKVGYLFFAWAVFAGMTHEGALESIIIASQRLLPVMFLHYLLLYRYKAEDTVYSLTFLVIFVMFSTIPFNLQLLKPLGQGYDVVSILGAEKLGFVGIFQNQHAAAITLGLCAIIATISYLQESYFSKKTMAGFIAIYLFVTLIMTYTRSGLIAYIAGIIVYLKLIGKVSSLMRFAIISVIAGSIFMYSFSEMDMLKSRLLGKTMYNQDSSVSADSISSGRLSFWKSALEIFVEKEPYLWIVGIGEEQLKVEMKARVGMSIFAHNGLINELLNNGIVGLLLLLYYYRCIFIDLRKITDKNIKTIALSVFSSWVTFIFFQGGEFPLQSIIIILFVYYSTCCSKLSLFETNSAILLPTMKKAIRNHD